MTLVHHYCFLIDLRLLIYIIVSFFSSLSFSLLFYLYLSSSLFLFLYLSPFSLSVSFSLLSCSLTIFLSSLCLCFFLSISLLLWIYLYLSPSLCLYPSLFSSLIRPLSSFIFMTAYRAKRWSCCDTNVRASWWQREMISQSS